jgi:hypothetical protein
MQTKHIVQFVFGLAVLILGNGCMTKQLWESSELEDWNQPAANSNLRVYQTEKKTTYWSFTTNTLNGTTRRVRGPIG